MAVPRWPALTVAKLAVRDGRRCCHCGTTETLTVQHRGVKGTGGRRSADRPSNGIILCWALNVAAEADPAAMALCIENGWKISSFADPSRIPYWDAITGEHYLLTDTFTRERAPQSHEHHTPPPTIRDSICPDPQPLGTR